MFRWRMGNDEEPNMDGFFYEAGKSEPFDDPKDWIREDPNVYTPRMAAKWRPLVRWFEQVPRRFFSDDESHRDVHPVRIGRALKDLWIDVDVKKRERYGSLMERRLAQRRQREAEEYSSDDEEMDQEEEDEEDIQP